MEKKYPAEFDCPRRADNRSRLGLDYSKGRNRIRPALQGREEQAEGGRGPSEEAAKTALAWLGGVRRMRRREGGGFGDAGQRGLREARDFCGTESNSAEGEGRRRRSEVLTGCPGSHASALSGCALPYMILSFFLFFFCGLLEGYY